MSKTPTRAELMRQVKALRHRVAALESSPGGGFSPSELEIALRERIKELDCLYTISTFQEMHFQSPDRYLQSVVDCLPKSWQFPEHACARIVYFNKEYTTEGFAEGKWRMSADITADGRPAGVVEVFYRKVVPTAAPSPFLKEEYALIRAVAERVGSVLMHMKAVSDLRAAHRDIQREHQALQEANIALRAVLSRLEEEKREIKASIVANIQKVIMPIVFELELEVTGRQRSYVTLLRQSLQEIASPFLTQMARDHMQLTPVEIAIGTMIRNGLSTKEIAQLRCISPATVRRHRENIRRKLGLRNRKVNLATCLQASTAGESASSVAAALPPPDQPPDPTHLLGSMGLDRFPQESRARPRRE
jgi:DNA-binding CsgD family transcriptional regulator